MLSNRPDRHQRAEAAEHVAPVGIQRVAREVAEPAHQQARDARGAAHVLLERRAQEGLGPELDRVRLAGEEDAAHRGGADAIGEARGEEGARADADIDVEAGQVDAVQHLVERAQGPELVHAADRAAAGHRESDLALLRRAFARAGSGLDDEHAGIGSGEVGADAQAAIVAGAHRTHKRGQRLRYAGVHVPAHVAAARARMIRSQEAERVSALVGSPAPGARSGAGAAQPRAVAATRCAPGRARDWPRPSPTSRRNPATRPRPPTSCTTCTAPTT